MNKDLSHDLPTWMRQSQQIADWGIVIVCCFSLIIAMPFMTQGGIPTNTALENHAYMAWSYADALREGRLYPRWIEGALSGYGAPIGNYYPPATPYITALLELFFTNDTVIATRLLAIGSILLCGIMTYLFLLRLMRAEYAVIGAMLYVYSPFIGLTVPYILGDLSLLFASALLSTTLWSMGRVLICQNGMDKIILALIYALLWLTHIEMAIVSTMIVMAFWGMMIPTQRIKRQHLFNGLFGMLMGLGLSAFFWLPAWLEYHLVTWIQAPYMRLLPTLRLEDMLRPITLIDLDQQVYMPQLAVGWSGIIFTAFGIMGIFASRLYQRWWLFWLVSACLMIGIGVSNLPNALWLMTPISLCLAIVGSATYGLSRFIPQQLQRLILPTIIIGICLADLPVWLAPRWSEEFQTWDISAQITYEQLGYGVAVLPSFRAIPITLPMPIVPNRRLLSEYQTGNVVRIPQSQLNPAKQAGLLVSESHRDQYFIETSTSATFEVLRAYADGWRADVDGTPVSLAPNPATGLIQVNIRNAAKGILTISYEATPIRERAWAISMGVMIILVLGVILNLFKRGRIHPFIELGLLPIQSARLIGLVIVAFGTFVVLFVIPQAPYSIYPARGYFLNHFVADNHKTDVGIELLGYDVIQPKPTYQVGDTIQVQVAWRTVKRLTDNYQVVVFLEAIDAPGLRWSQTAPRYLAGYPTRRWSLQKYHLDEYHIRITDTLAKGDYRLVIELYRCTPSCSYDNRVNFFTSDGQFIGSQVALSARFRVQ